MKTIRQSRINPKIEVDSVTYKVTSGDICVRVYLHDGYIELVDEELDKKSYVFAGKDSPAKRALWLKILKVMETAIRQLPDQNRTK